MELDDLRDDLSAFADDEAEVELDRDGSFMLLRNGREITGRIVAEADQYLVRRPDSADVTYRDFLLRDLAGMHILAERLTSRRQVVASFIDTEVRVERAMEPPTRGRSLDKLRLECEDVPPFSARVSFITADAGHGKTALLREFQHRQATLFLAGKSRYIFWHVDLQGRQLLRLSEALMGDLADLRITGLWMPAVVRLLRHQALVLGIDGFDELAAEQGSTDALGALAALVGQLGGHGTVVAAARRTFFDTDDYLRRTGMLSRAIASPCEFSQLSLLPWSRADGVQYMQSALAGRDPGEAERTYDDVLAELGNDAAHPMLTRPFLLAQIIRALNIYEIAPREFFQVADDNFAAIARVIDAFIKREVSDKWKSRDTGEPYLTVEQHMQLLADVAEEMYRAQKDRLDLDVIETIAVLLFDQWRVDNGQRQKIIEMVRMHVLLVPAEGDARSRSFDHPEFRDYFIAYALRAHIERVMDGAESKNLAYFLSIAQISDSTARYVCGMIDRSEERVRVLLSALESAVANEWRPTFLQVNAGTLIPYVVNDVDFTSEAAVAAKVVYTSLVFERTRLRNVTLRNASFVNVSLRDVDWRDVRLENCALGELTLGEGNKFERVVASGCKVDGVRAAKGEEEVREYAPHRIWTRLAQAGIASTTQPTLEELEEADLEEGPEVRALRRLLRMFARTTSVTDDQLRARFRQDLDVLFATVIPAMEAHEILAQRKWHGAGQKQAWSIRERVDAILAAEGGSGDPRLVRFWAEIRKGA